MSQMKLIFNLALLYEFNYFIKMHLDMGLIPLWLFHKSYIDTFKVKHGIIIRMAIIMMLIQETKS